jgi:hypothetical protein
VDGDTRRHALHRNPGWTKIAQTLLDDYRQGAPTISRQLRRPRSRTDGPAGQFPTSGQRRRRYRRRHGRPTSRRTIWRSHRRLRGADRQPALTIDELINIVRGPIFRPVASSSAARASARPIISAAARS